MCRTCQRWTADRSGTCGRVLGAESASPRRRGGACAMMSCGLPPDGDAAAAPALSSLLSASPPSPGQLPDIFVADTPLRPTGRHKTAATDDELPQAQQLEILLAPHGRQQTFRLATMIN